MRPVAQFSKHSIRGRALSLAAIAASVAALGGASAALGSVGSAVKASTPACRTSGLVIWLNTNPNGAAGTIFYTLKFTNLSGHTCTLRGYPGVSAVNLSGGRLGRSANRLPGTPVRTITIRNGRTASANLGIAEAGDFPRSSCAPVTGAGLKVIAPNQVESKTVPFPFLTCSRGASNLRIQAVR